MTLALFMLMLGAAACTSDSNDNKKASWTVFVYGHGDHNLSNSLLADMIEMAGAKMSDDLKLIVMADWDSSQKVKVGGTELTDNYPSGSEWYRVRGGGADGLELLETTSDEQNLDDPAVVAASITKAFTTFPAERYGLILWDHGGSWITGFGSDTQNGTVAMPTGISIKSLAAAVNQGLSDGHLSGERPLDFLAFDTCLMAGAEVTHEFRHAAKVYIGNAELDYGNGWDYTTTMTHLSDNSGEGIETFAKSEVGFWDAHHKQAGDEDTLLRSHVALRAADIDAFTQSVSALSEMLANPNTPVDDFARSGYYSSPTYASTEGMDTLRDLGQLADLAGKNMNQDAIKGALANTSTSLTKMIVARSQGDLRGSKNQVGFHLELPLTELSSNRLALYDDKASFGADSGWSKVLEHLLSAKNTTSGPVFSEHNVSDATGAMPTVHFTVTSPNVTQAHIEFGCLQGSDFLLFGLAGHGAINNGEANTFAWDRTAIGLDAGNGDVVQAYLSLEVEGSSDGSGQNMDAFLSLLGTLQLEPGAADVLARLIFKESDQSADTVIIESMGSDAPSVFALAELAQYYPAATFAPLLPVWSGNLQDTQFAQATALPIPSSGKFAFAAYSTATTACKFFTTAYDFWGNETTESDDVPAQIQ